MAMSLKRGLEAKTDGLTDWLTGQRKYDSDSEDGGSKVIWNVNILPHGCSASQIRRPQLQVLNWIKNWAEFLKIIPL
jgi:hypothetical protein